MDIVFMLLILAFLVFMILYKAKCEDTFESFFDLKNSQAMRGFWCLIVILVHVPQFHANKVQDMIGSFAFIGVTFFFMTSSYGLTLSMNNNPNKIRIFWRQRLPKLLITSWIVNIISVILGSAVGIHYNSVASFVVIGDWVIWLIICYFFFWLAHMIIRENRILVDLVTCILVTIFSITAFVLKNLGVYTRTIWDTECYGFVWGILLALFSVSFYNYFKDKWFLKLAISCFVSLIIGVCYLKYKYIPFAGSYLLKILLGVCITTFVLISNVKISYGNKINHFLGMISFEIYLLHGFSFRFIDKLSNGSLSSGMFILSSIILTVLLAYITHTIVLKVMKAVNKVLL